MVATLAPTQVMGPERPRSPRRIKGRERGPILDPRGTVSTICPRLHRGQMLLLSHECDWWAGEPTGEGLERPWGYICIRPEVACEKGSRGNTLR